MVYHIFAQDVTVKGNGSLSLNDDAAQVFCSGDLRLEGGEILVANKYPDYLIGGRLTLVSGAYRMGKLVCSELIIRDGELLVNSAEASRRLMVYGGKFITKSSTQTEYAELTGGIVQLVDDTYPILYNYGNIAILPSVIENCYLTLAGHIFELPNLEHYSAYTAFWSQYCDGRDAQPYTGEVDEKFYYFSISPSGSVTFNPNGGSGSMTGITDFSGVYTLPENGFTPPEGKKFVGWSLTADGSDLLGETVRVTGALEIFAVWKGDADLPDDPSNPGGSDNPDNSDDPDDPDDPHQPGTPDDPDDPDETDRENPDDLTLQPRAVVAGIVIAVVGVLLLAGGGVAILLIAGGGITAAGIAGKKMKKRKARKTAESVTEPEVEPEVEPEAGSEDVTE